MRVSWRDVDDASTAGPAGNRAVVRLGPTGEDPLSSDRGVKSTTPKPLAVAGRVLVACERSGKVRDAFSALGFDAVSCDLEETATPGPHLRCDIRDVDRSGWDMVIAFPPCTFLTAAGAWRWPYTTRERNEAVRLVQYLWDWPVDRLAIENPQGWLNSHWRKPDGRFEPYWFGDAYTKRSYLWLRQLPPLMPTLLVPPAASWTEDQRHNKDRSGARSLTFGGVAHAMALQWGPLL